MRFPSVRFLCHFCTSGQARRVSIEKLRKAIFANGKENILAQN
jgi:hypothetical protein